MSALEAACKYLGWSGGTCHDARRELERREEAMMRQHAMMDEESGAPEVIRSLELDIATVQHILACLPDA